MSVLNEEEREKVKRLLLEIQDETKHVKSAKDVKKTYNKVASLCAELKEHEQWLKSLEKGNRQLIADIVTSSQGRHGHALIQRILRYFRQIHDFSKQQVHKLVFKS